MKIFEKASYSFFEIFDIACTENAILITADKDFARICFAWSLQKNQSINIILLRKFFFSEVLSQRILDSLSRLEETQKRNFIVMDRNKIRIRTY